MNQTWKNDKKSLGLILARLALIWAFKFFCEFYLMFYLIVDIVARYHCMQFQEKLKKPNLRKWQKNP